MAHLQTVQQPDAAAQQPPAEPVLRAHGPMEEDTFHKELFLTNLNLYPFVGDWLNTVDWVSHSILPTMGYFATMGRWLNLNNNTKPNEHNLFTVLLGEMMTSVLPVAWIGDQLKSRATLVSSVQALINYMAEFPDLIPQFTRADYNRIYNEILLPRPHVGFLNNDDIDNDNPFKDRLTVDAKEPRFEPEVNSWPENTVHIEGLTYKNAMICLYLISMNAAACQQKTGLNVIAHTILAAVRGETRNDIAKVEKGINADLFLYMQKGVEIIPEVLPIYHKYYGGRITELTAPALFNLWETWMPNLPTKLLVTVQRAAGSRFTIYFTICKALIQHHKFDWTKVARLLETDWNNYHRDANIIGNNQFYEFKQNQSNVKPLGYRSLGYVAKHLLLRVDGDEFINQYYGWPSCVSNHQAITTIIDRYVTDYTKERNAGLGYQIQKLRAALVTQKLFA